MLYSLTNKVTVYIYTQRDAGDVVFLVADILVSRVQ